MTHYIPENNVYVYFRYTDNKTVMILMNNSNEIKLSKLPVSRKTWKNLQQENILTIYFQISTEISLEPKSVVILELK
jgi:hypothetical protein